MTSWPRPLEGSYGAMVTIALLALVPYIITTTSEFYYSNEIAKALDTNRAALGIVTGLATAGYAFGALLGGDLINRFPQRRLFLACETIFVAGSMMAASAHSLAPLGAGEVLTGFATGLLLVIALPPVIRRFPARRLPVTVVFVNIGFFGAVTAGPVLGGVVAGADAWRSLYAGFGGTGALNLALAFVTLPNEEPPNPDLPFDWHGLALGFLATVLPFWASGEIARLGFGSVWFIAPMTLGLGAFVALLVTEYYKKEPLSPVRMMWSTFPVIGTLVAMVAGGVLVTFERLGAEVLLRVGHQGALAAGLIFWPQLAAVLISAALLGVVIRTRLLPILILAGMAALIGGGGLLATAAPAGMPVKVMAAAGLLGLGAGATVSPGLYLAAFPLPSTMVARIFALVELVRSVADFILAPVMQGLARVYAGGRTPTAGALHASMWTTVTLTLVLTGAGIWLYLTSGAGLPRPDLERWVDKKETAMQSPPLFAAIGHKAEAASRPSQRKRLRR